MSRLSSIRALVLRRRDFMENDMIATLLCEDGHRVEAIVKGIRNGTSKRRAHLENFNLVSATLYQSNNHLYLQSIQAENSFHRIKESLDNIMKLHPVLEIVERSVLENDPHPEIFDLLLRTLSWMNQEQIHPMITEITLVKLAHHLGFLPNFKACSLCHVELSQDDARWDAEGGTLSCTPCSRFPHEALPLKYRKALAFFQVAAHEDCQKLTLEREESAELSRFIPQLFTAHLDKPLKSLELRI